MAGVSSTEPQTSTGFHCLRMSFSTEYGVQEIRCNWNKFIAASKTNFPVNAAYVCQVVEQMQNSSHVVSWCPAKSHMRVCAYKHVCAHTYTHACMHTQTCAHANTNMCTMSACAHKHTRAPTFVYAHTNMCACAYKHACVRTQNRRVCAHNLYAYIHVCARRHTHTHMCLLTLPCNASMQLGTHVHAQARMCAQMDLHSIRMLTYL